MQVGRAGNLGCWEVELPAMSRVMRPVGECNLVEWVTWGGGWLTGWVAWYVQGIEACKGLQLGKMGQ